jgi:hypothetical protein
MTQQFFHEYRAHKFQASAQKTINHANAIITEMQAQGYILTLRQLYYQFVRRNLIANTEKEYKRLGRLVTSAREAGIMDWLSIEDRGRTPYGFSYQDDPAEVVRGIEERLKVDRWANQDTYIELWVEKQALESVIARPARQMHVTYMACKGYLSASEAWRAGLRFQQAIDRGQTPVLLHLADHDPSGLNMTEDNRNRIRLFAEDHSIEVKRLALNMDQVEQYAPPPNPAKETDSRAADYVQRYGPHSWELDALEPAVLNDLIRDEIQSFVDWTRWEESEELEMELRKPLAALSGNWEAVRDFLASNDMIQ